MIVEKQIVYRIVPFDADVKVEEPALPSKWKTTGNYKLRQEETLEEHRPKGFPRRDSCLYVCFSKENAYEWAYIKYGKRNIPYKLLTLQIDGDLYWLKSDCYNFLDENSSQQMYDQASEDYWNSLIEDEKLLTLDKGYEGLFVGKNKIIAIEFKNYINGESYDIE